MVAGVEERGRVATINFLDEVTLTDNFEDNESEAYAISPFSQLELIFDYTRGQNDSDGADNYALVKLLLSENGTDWHEYAIASDAAAVDGVVECTLYPRRFKINGPDTLDVVQAETRWWSQQTSAKYIKILACEVNVEPGEDYGTLTVKARVSNDLSLK